MTFHGAQNRNQRKKRSSHHDALAPFRIPRTAHARRSSANSGRRASKRDAARGRHGPAAEYETAATSSAHTDELAPHRKLEPRRPERFRFPTRRLPHAL